MVAGPDEASAAGVGAAQRRHADPTVHLLRSSGGGHRAKPYSSPGIGAGQGAANVEVWRNPLSPGPSRRGERSAAPPGHEDALMAAIEAGWADPRRPMPRRERPAGRLDQGREVLAGRVGCAPCRGLLRLRRRRRRTSGGRRAPARRASPAGPGWSPRRPALGLPRPGSRPPEPCERAARLHEVPVDAYGRVQLDALTEVLKDPAVVVAALQHGNAEVGTLQPIAQAAEAAASAGVPLVVDAQASLGRTTLPERYDVWSATPARGAVRAGSGSWSCPSGPAGRCRGPPTPTRR